MAHFIDFVVNNWLLVAFMAPLFWSLVNIIDVYFVGSIYKDEMEGVIISGVFQIIPWAIIILAAGVDLPSLISKAFWDGLGVTMLFSLVGGIFFLVSFYFYFKALFKKNDAPMLQVLWNLTVVVVPLLAFLIFNEVLPFRSYAGLLAVILGATMLSLNPGTRLAFSGGYLRIMAGAIFFMSLSMIFEEGAYNQLGATLGPQGFWLGFSGFCWGALVVAILFLLISRRNVGHLIHDYWKVFLLSEGIYFLGNLASQRALDISPSPSYVAAIEPFVSVFVLVYSLLIINFLSGFWPARAEEIKEIYLGQVTGMGTKILATLIMAAGIYLIY